MRSSHVSGPAAIPARREDLDGLRAVAVALVMLGHLDDHWRDGGNAGVTAFFVLSGFLITGILNEELTRTGRVDLRSFYRRRIRRLAPALLVLAVVATIWSSGGAFERIVPTVGSLLYVNNWLEVVGAPMGLVGHTWSLAIEEQFYLLWPVALLFLKPRRAVMVAIVLAAGSAVVRFIADGSFEYFSTFARADAILVGSALALLGWRAWPPVVAFVGILGLLVVSLSGLSHDLAIPLSILSASAVIMSRFPLLGRLAPIGRRAYSLYLWNWPLTLLLGAPGFVATILVAEASYRFAERPFMRPRPQTQATWSRRIDVLARTRRYRPALLAAMLMTPLVAFSCLV